METPNYPSFLVLPAMIGFVCTIAFVMAVRLILLSRSARNISEATLLITMVFALIGYVYQIFTPDLPSVLFWQKIQVLGINFMYPAWLLFILLLTGNRKYICRRLLVLLFLLSLFPNVVLNTPSISSWFVTTHGLIQAGPYNILRQDLGWVVWFSTSIATIQGIVGSLFLLNQRRKLRSAYKPHFYLLLLLPIIPFLAIWLEISGLNPVAPLSLFNYSIIPVCAVITFTIFSLRVGEEHNRLKENVVDSMHSAVVILDSRDRIQYANPAAWTLLGEPMDHKENLPLAQVSPEISEFLSTKLSHIGQPNLITLGDFVFDLKMNNTFDWRGETVAKMIVLTNITENDQLGKKIFDQNREISHTNALLSGLAEVNLFFQSTNNLNDMFRILDKVMNSFGFSFFLTTIDPTSNDLVVNYLSSSNNKIQRVERMLGSKVSGFHIQETHFPQLYNFLYSRTTTQSFNSTMLLEDTSLHPAIKEAICLFFVDPSPPFVMLQLQTGDKPLGILAIWGNALDEKDIPTFRIFASQIANAVERNRAYQEELDRSKELTKSNQLITALVRVATLMGSSGDYKESLHTLGSEIEQLNLHCLLGTLDQELETITFEYSSFSRNVISMISQLTNLNFIGFKLPKKYWPGTRVTHEGKTVWYSSLLGIFQKMFPQIPDSTFAKIMKVLQLTDDQKLCILPLKNQGKVIGVFALWGEGISEKDTSTLTVFAYQVSQILERIKVYEEEQHRSMRLTRSNAILIALSKVASRLETTIELGEIYQTLGGELKNVGIECMVGMLDEKKENMTMEYISVSQFIIEYVRARNVKWPTLTRVPRSLWPTDRTVVNKEPFWDVDPIGNIIRMFPFIPKKMVSHSFQVMGMPENFQMCYLPIIVSDDVVGILAVWGPDMQAEDMPGLMVFANQVSTSIQNAKLFDQAQKEIVIRTEAEKKIHEALTEKEVLLKEVHHRVKNNLQIISSLLNLQMGQSTDPVLLQGLRESQSRVSAMALIHEKLYQSDDLSKIDMASYISGLISALKTTYRIAPEKVKIQVESANIYLDLESAIPCGLIINELISNSMKYAFPDDKKGVIHISFQEPRSGEYQLIVEDNGIGLSKDFVIEKGSSLGLKLVSGLVRQIDGVMKVSKEGGVNFEICFSSNQ